MIYLKQLCIAAPYYKSGLLRDANRMMELLDHSPYDFIMNSSNNELATINNFVHWTFNSSDLIYFLKALQNIHRHKGGLENIFKTHQISYSLQPAIHQFNIIFFELPNEKEQCGTFRIHSRVRQRKSKICT